MEKILVQWSDGRSKGATSILKEKCSEERDRYCREESHCYVGKVKEDLQRTHVGHGRWSALSTKPSARHGRPFSVRPSSSGDADTGCGSPEPVSTHAPQTAGRRKTCLEKLDDLSDAVSGIEARLLCRLQTLDEKVMALQKDVQEKCIFQLTVHPSSLTFNESGSGDDHARANASSR